MNRYSKQIQLEGIGIEGQEKLSNARVLVVGSGGLGCAVIPYLAGAGVGTIGIAEGDVVETSNLHRQIIYKENDLGFSKAKKAATFIQGLNSEIEAHAYSLFLTGENAKSIFTSYDIIVDATDSIPVRLMINETAEHLGQPVVYASVYKYEAQLSVFNYQDGPTYSDVFGTDNRFLSNCVEVGVLGTTVGIIGTMQAHEVLKMILGIGRVLSGKLLVYNGLTNEQNVFTIKKRERAEEQDKKSALNDSLPCLVSAEEAFASENTEIIDIRESVEEPHFDSEIVKRVPFSILGPYMKTIPTDRPVYFLCQTGMRSLLAARQYRNQGYQAKSIEGGIIQIQKQWTYET